MIVWSGRGFLSIVVFFATLLLLNSILPEGSTDYTMIISSFVSGIFSWYFGIIWNVKNQRIVIDEETGQRIKIKNIHTLFWIPMQYWGILFSVFGIIILFQNSIIFGVFASFILLALILIPYIGKILKSESKTETTFPDLEKTETNNTNDFISQLKEKNSLKEFEPSDHSKFMPK